MRMDRFHLLVDAAFTGGGPSPAVTEAVTFTACGEEVMRFGHRISFDNGGRVYFGWVQSSPPGGDDHAQPETRVTGDVLPSAPVPDLVTQGGQYRTGDIEAYLIALINNSGSDEICEIRGYSGDPRRPAHLDKYGITVVHHSGAKCHGMFVHMLRKGERLGSRPKHEILEGV